MDSSLSNPDTSIDKVDDIDPMLAKTGVFSAKNTPCVLGDNDLP